MSQKVRNIIGWVLTALIAFVFISSGIMKFMANPEMIAKSSAMGITTDTIKILGTLELASILLFIIPRTGIIGTLLLAAYMGGAIATHLQHQMPLMAPIVIECVIWITAVIRLPELGSRLMGGGKATV